MNRIQKHALKDCKSKDYPTCTDHFVSLQAVGFGTLVALLSTDGKELLLSSYVDQKVWNRDVRITRVARPKGKQVATPQQRITSLQLASVELLRWEGANFWVLAIKTGTG